MKHLNPSFLALLLLLAAGPKLHSQDAELGELPPMPNLNLGDPERKLPWKVRRAIARSEQAAQEANNDRRQTEDSTRVSLGQKLSNASNQSKSKPLSQKITVHNALPGGEDGITASGSRLQPFGDSDFWGQMPAPTPEETLIDLPPLPDLRTPDQVTRRERIRDLRVAKYEQRKAQIEAEREEKEMRERATVNRPTADPSSALVQVESRGTGAAGYGGNQAAPETVGEGELKPFNENSVYFRDNQMVYKGDRRDATSGPWWKRSSNKE
jgi:hypothetical protein